MKLEENRPITRKVFRTPELNFYFSFAVTLQTKLKVLPSSQKKSCLSVKMTNVVVIFWLINNFPHLHCVNIIKWAPEHVIFLAQVNFSLNRWSCDQLSVTTSASLIQPPKVSIDFIIQLCLDNVLRTCIHCIGKVTWFLCFVTSSADPINWCFEACVREWVLVRGKW